jgi:hypothetical protein
VVVIVIAGERRAAGKYRAGCWQTTNSKLSRLPKSPNNYFDSRAFGQRSAASGFSGSSQKSIATVTTLHAPFPLMATKGESNVSKLRIALLFR